MRVIGIDCGYAITGWGVVEKNGNEYKSIDYGDISTSKDMTPEDRLDYIYDNLSRIIKEYEVEEASVEELFYFKNQKTVIQVAQSRGIILLCCKKNGLEIAEYTPLQVKQTLTGNGRAEKAQVQKMIKMMLGMKEIPKPDDAADGLALAYTHLLHSRLSRKLKV